MIRKILFMSVLIAGFICRFGGSDAIALSAAGIDTEVDATLKIFEDVQGSKSVIKTAEGLLVFPSIVKAGFIIGGEYGEGALRIDGKTAGYYNTAAASFGFQFGAQKKSIIIAFMDKDSLSKFRNSSGWKVGADASIAVISVGADGSIDTSKHNEPIIAFVFDQKGLMYNLTLEGAKITKINK